MRRLIGTVASGLGMFLVVFALLMYFYLPKVAIKFPLSTYAVTTLVGNNVSYFSTSKLTELSGVTMHITNTTQGDPSAGTTDTAVYNMFSYVYDETNKATYAYSQNRVAFDRRTGELVNCCGAAIGLDMHVHMSGQGPYFPFSTGQHNYQLFNYTLRKPVTAVYKGSGVTDGLTTYEFVASVPATRIGTQQVPGSLVGSPAATVTLGEYYQGSTTYLVNPQTGVPVKAIEQQHVSLRDSTGADRLVLLDGTFTETPASVQDAVNRINNHLGLLDAATTTGPLITGIVGIIVLIVGLVMGILGRNDEGLTEEREY